MAERFGPKGMALSEILDSCDDPLVLDLCRYIEILEPKAWKWDDYQADALDWRSRCDG